MPTTEPPTDLVGVARDAETITEVLAEMDRSGFRGQFVPVEDEPGLVECITCKQRSPAGTMESDQLRRLEGASDPDDMLAIAALVCPHCGTRGTIVLNYGPAGTAVDDAILGELEPPPPPSSEPASPEQT